MDLVSLPSRERELKCPFFQKKEVQFVVAPFTGAWIEMTKLRA